MQGTNNPVLRARSGMAYALYSTSVRLLGEAVVILAIFCVQKVDNQGHLLCECKDELRLTADGILCSACCFVEYLVMMGISFVCTS